MSEQTTEQAGQAEKAADECAFPECHRKRVPKDPAVRGTPPKYCDDPDHNAATAYKAKHRRPMRPRRPGHPGGRHRPSGDRLGRHRRTRARVRPHRRP